MVAKISITTVFLLRKIFKALSSSYCCILENIPRVMWKTSILQLKPVAKLKLIPVFIRRNIQSISPDFIKCCPLLGRREKIVRATVPSSCATILIPDSADASAWSAPAKSKQGFLPSALTHCLCPLCRAQHWLFSCLLSAPLHCCWFPLGSQHQGMSCLYFSDDVEVKELTLQIYDWFGQDHCKAWHFC